MEKKLEYESTGFNVVKIEKETITLLEIGSDEVIVVNIESPRYYDMFQKAYGYSLDFPDGTVHEKKSVNN